MRSKLPVGNLLDSEDHPAIKMIRCRHLAKNLYNKLTVQATKQCYGTSGGSKGSNIAQGDTIRPSDNKEIANASKGNDLARADNLENVTIKHGAQAFEGDLRSTSGLGMGDGLYSHTAKWNEV